MSHTRVKTTYSKTGAYGSTETKELYCDHSHGCDCVTYYNKDGSVTAMAFEECEKGNDLWDAMQRLYYPFEHEWGGQLKPNVEYYFVAPWEEEA